MIWWFLLGSAGVSAAAWLVRAGAADVMAPDGTLDRATAAGAIAIYWCLTALVLFLIVRIRRDWRPVAVVVGTIVLTVSVVEIALRIFLPERTLPRLQRIASPGHHHRHPADTTMYAGTFDGRHVTVRTNEDGFRSSYSRVRFRELTDRIVVLGDSFVLGREVPEQDTLSQQLERRLRVARGRDDIGVLGEFNWSSQHLDDEVLRCRNGNGDGQTGRVGLRCVRLVGRRQRGVRSSNGSGRRSRGGCRVRMPLCPVACRRPWVVVGSVRAVVCRRSAWRPDRLATCPWRSGKRSRSCERRAPGCVTLPVGSGEPRRLSRESYVATRRLGAAVWRIGRRLRSGTAPDVPSARR